MGRTPKNPVKTPGILSFIQTGAPKKVQMFTIFQGTLRTGVVKKKQQKLWTSRHFFRFPPSKRNIQPKKHIASNGYVFKNLGISRDDEISDIFFQEIHPHFVGFLGFLYVCVNPILGGGSLEPSGVRVLHLLTELYTGMVG